jgi:hypothetical protein
MHPNQALPQRRRLNPIAATLARLLATAAGALCLAQAGFAADGKTYELRQTHVCDTSACYLAWEVVDSDEDGICDADEIVAGTHPYDPLSRPPLKELVDLAAKDMLPSFAAGLGIFAVLPPELQALAEQQRGGEGDLSAFPLSVPRATGLERFGLSSSLLKQMGLDPESQAITIGIDLGQDTSGIPPRLVGGVDVRLISADSTPAPKPAPKPSDPADDPVPIPPPPHDNHGYKTNEAANSIKYEDGCIRYDYPGGSYKIVDPKGNTVVKGYVNPDADSGSGSVPAQPTEEERKRMERMRNAVSWVVDTESHLDLSQLSPEDIETGRGTIILVDPDYATSLGLVVAGSGSPRPPVTKAQPETRPDLPNPGVPACTGSPSGC